jgi:hypothetical protein
MNHILSTYDYIMSIGDPRVLSWPLVNNPFEPLSVLVIHAFIIYFGIKLMAKRKPFDLKLFLYVYNFLQVIGSFYIFYEVSVKLKFKYLFNVKLIFFFFFYFF